MNWQCRLLGAVLLLGPGPAVLAQEGAGPVKHFYNKTSFRIPVVMDDQERATLAELRLYYRQPPGEWMVKASAPATQTAFNFQADRDGEYWFNIATIDRSGKTMPEDLKRQEAALIVVVDTTLPEIDVRPLPVGNQVYLQCRIIDANPDYNSVRIQAKATDGTWHPMEGVPNTPGVVQVADQRVLDGFVRVRAADRAGNVVEREIDMNRTKVAGPAPVVRGAPTPNPTPDPIAAVKDPIAPAPPPRIITDGSTGDPLPKPVDGPAVTIPSATADKRPLPPTPPGVDPAGPVLPRPMIGGTEPTLKPSDLVPDASRPEGQQIPVIGSLRCRIDFALEPIPGGVAEVEVWATVDHGKSWKIVGVSKDGRSPATVEFPGEGKYGFAFVVKPISGLTSSLPKAGEAPDGWLEIDMSRPAAELTHVAPGIGPDAGFLLVNWSAKDANLAADSVTLLYATQPGGPWVPIAEKIANSGSHRWPLPKTIGPRAWVRLEVRDRAGNVTGCESQQPVALEGPRARVRVIGVGPAQQ